MTRVRGFLMPLGILLGASLAGAQGLVPPLTFHASFDGTLDAVAAGGGTPVKVEGPVEYRPGKVGQALLCGEGGALAYYAAAGNLRTAAGTVEMWVCPLDWTGEKDEFHVFLESQDPGWLVFYRYYQGGILTLLGTSAGVYRSAASPPIHWTPGEWHHLAGTWRTSGLEVYIDGVRQGFSPDIAIPERFGETFRVGDHPWHVPRTAQTLIDEVKLYSAPLTPESIARAARGERIDYTPQLALKVTADPDSARLHVLLDAAGLVGEGAPGRTARVELLPKGDGDVLAAQDLGGFAADVARAELPVDAVAEGDYDVRATLLGDADRVVATASTPFHKPGPPVWSGNTLGLADRVLPPWTPLLTDSEAHAVECWGRRYEFGPMLSQVTSGDVKLLASPVRLEAVVRGVVVPLTGEPARIGDAGETRAVLSAETSGMKLRATMRHQVDYDGFTWTDVDLDVDAPVAVDELRLAWSMPASQATLLHADSLQWMNNQSGALKPEGWSSPGFLHFLWLGDEDRGLAWYAETDRDWVTAENTPAIQVARDGDRVDVTVRLIGGPTRIAGRRQYGFGLMATPCRPRPENARRWRMTPGVRPTFDIIWPNGNLKYYGYPDPEQPEEFAERVKASHEKGCLVVPYVNLNFMSAGAPEWQYYGSRWADPDRVVTPSDVAEMGHASMGTCPAVRDWQDFILYRISEMIDRYDIDGIYIDCWSPYPCRAEPCGWRDADGNVRPTRPIRAYREILRRVYALFREKRPDPLLMVHMSSQVVIPMLSFTDTILDGEQWVSGNLKDDYLGLMPPDLFRAEFMGVNYGPVDFFLPEFRGDYVQPGTPNLAAYLMLHDVNAWPIWCAAEYFNRLYEVEGAFGIEKAEFRPYWRGSGVVAPPEVLVSSYAKDGEVLLAVMNTGEAVQAELALDMQTLGLADLGSAVDVLREEEVGAAGNVLSVPLGRHQGRVIHVRRQ